MPGRDGTGPNGTYQNCRPTGDEPIYGMRGRRRRPGMGGRGRGFMNMFYATGQPGRNRDAYQPQQPQKEVSSTLERLVGALEKILERFDKK